MASARQLRAGKAIIELSLLDNTAKQLKALQVRMRNLGATLTHYGRVGVAAGGAVVGAFFAASKAFASTGDTLHKMSQRTGFSAESLSELGFAAEQNGASIDQLDKSLAAMARFSVMAERGLATATDVLEMLNINLDDFKKQTPEKRFKLIAQAISTVADPTLRAGLALKVFGRSGRELLPMLSSGSAGIEALQAEARSLGITLSRDDATAAAELTDAMNRLWRQTKAIAVAVGAAVAGPLTQFYNRITPILKVTIDWVKKNKKLIQTIGAVATVVLGVGGLILGTGLLLTVASIAAGGFATAIGVVGTVLGVALSKIGLVTLGLSGLVTWFATSTRAGRAMVTNLAAWFGQLYAVAQETFGGITDALAGGEFELAGRIAMAGLNLAWTEGTQDLHRIWLEFRDLFLRTTTNMVFDAQEAFVNMLAGVKKSIANIKLIAATLRDYLKLDFATGFGSKTDKFNAGAGLVGNFARRAAETKAAIAQAEADRKEALAKIEASRDIVDDDLSKQHAKDLKAAEERLGYLRDQLAALREQAAEGKKLAAQQFNLQNAAFGGMQLAARGEARSLFDTKFAAQVFGNGGTNGTAELQLKEQRISNKQFREMIRLMEANPGLIWGE